MNLTGKDITYCRKHESHKPDYTASQPRRPKRKSSIAKKASNITKYLSMAKTVRLKVLDNLKERAAQNVINGVPFCAQRG
jgi:hypothetical protein